MTRVAIALDDPALDVPRALIGSTIEAAGGDPSYANVALKLLWINGWLPMPPEVDREGRP